MLKDPIGTKAHFLNIFWITQHQQNNVGLFYKILWLFPFCSHLKERLSFWLSAIENSEIEAFIKKMSAHVCSHDSGSNPANFNTFVHKTKIKW